MRIKLTAFNKKCPNSCIKRALTLDERYKMYALGGLGGSFQFSMMKDIPLRTSSILVDMTEPLKYYVTLDPALTRYGSCRSLIQALSS